MNNNIEEIYKKKYLKYKSKYLTIQLGGVNYYNGVNYPDSQVISDILPTFKLDNNFYPRLMALDADGNVVVADAGNDCLLVFSIRDNKHIRKIGKSGDGPVEFREPSGVAFDKKGNICIADTYNNRVQILNYKDGAHVKDIGSSTLNQPCSVAFDNEGNVVVLDENDNGHISVFDINTGAFIRKMCPTGTKPGYLKGTGSIVFDREGFLVVTDPGNKRVQVLNYSDGTNVGTISNTKFNSPIGVALDLNGNIFVTDFSGQQVHVLWYKDGEYLMTFNGQDIHNKKFISPYGVVIDDKGHIIVSDYTNHLVRVFSPLKMV